MASKFPWLFLFRFLLALFPDDLLLTLRFGVDELAGLAVLVCLG